MHIIGFYFKTDNRIFTKLISHMNHFETWNWLINIYYEFDESLMKFIIQINLPDIQCLPYINKCEKNYNDYWFS